MEVVELQCGQGRAEVRWCYFDVASQCGWIYWSLLKFCV